MASEAFRSLGIIKLGQQFELDLSAYELRRAGQPLRLERIPMELLFLLVERRGQLVTREQIVDKIWGKEVYLDTDNSINAAIRKIRQVLSDNSDEPRYIQTVIGRGYRFVAAVEIAQPELEAAAPPTIVRRPDLPPANRKRNRAAMRVVASLCLIVVLLGGFTFTSFRERLFHRALSGDTEETDKRPSVAVLGFRNLSDKEDALWISTALSEMVSADLAGGQKLRLIPGECVTRVKSDLNLPATDSYSPDTLNKIRQNLNSDLVVLGSYLASGERGKMKIHLNVKVQDTKSGEIIAAVSEDGTESDLAQLVSRSDEGIRQILHVANSSAGEEAEVRAMLLKDPEAVRYYAEGLVKWGGWL